MEFNAFGVTTASDAIVSLSHHSCRDNLAPPVCRIGVGPTLGIAASGQRLLETERVGESVGRSFRKAFGDDIVEVVQRMSRTECSEGGVTGSREWASTTCMRFLPSKGALPVSK